MITRILQLGPWATSMSVLAAWLPQQCQGPFGGGFGNQGGSVGVGGAGANAGGQASTTGGNATTGGTTGVTSDAGTSATCGNGVVEPGEACDDGLQNGAANRCDPNCQFVCTGSCPIRVNPNASSNGSGDSWQDPANDVQGALDTQVSRGGGEVWVLGGSFASLSTTDGDLLSVGSGVSLLGGFVGTETSVGQRDPSAPLTQLNGPENGVAAALVAVDAAADVLIDGIHFVNGEPSFRVVDSERVTLRNVVAEASVNPTDNIDEVTNSSARIESSTIGVPFNHDGLLLDGSRVAIDDSTLFPTPLSGAAADDWRISMLQVKASLAFIHRTQVNLRAEIAADSQVLAVDSVLEGGPGMGPAFYVEGKAAIVGCSFGNARGATPLTVDGQALVFQSSFINSYGTLAHGRWAVASAIAGAGSIDVSLSTFLTPDCSEPLTSPCPIIGAATINNSLFVPEVPNLSPPVTDYFPPETLVTADGVLPPSNCAVYSGDFFDTGGGELGGVQPCPNGGDAAKLEASRAAVMAFAVPFTSAPFNANLTRYQSPSFWRDETVVVTPCGDTGAPDPGRHFPCNP